MTLFNGLATALITPFSGDKIDYKTLKLLIDQQVKAGVAALVPIGTTGEGLSLSFEEQVEIMDFVIKEVDKRALVIPGTGSCNTKTAIALSEKAKSLGADGLMVITPFYTKGSQESVIAHYEAITMASDLPMILYHNPGRTGLWLTPETLYTLAQMPTIVGLKEASGDFSYLAKLLAYLPKDFSIYAGNDDMILPMMALGARGAFSVASNVAPGRLNDLLKACLANDYQLAQDLHQALYPLFAALACEVNPVPIKEALHLVGLGDGKPRLPLLPLKESGKEVLGRALEEMGLGNED